LQTTQAEAAPAVESPKIDFSFYLPLPQLSYGFYGRRREYREIRDGIIQRNQRAVIVHGIGGIGKTALVSHVATRMKKRFQGVYAFDCTSRALTPETVMIKLNQYFATQGVNALEQLLFQNLPADVLASYLAQVLSQWSLLLIFDNFESQLEHTDDGFRIADENLRTFVTTLVKTTATGSHFLFTSRYLFELDDKRLGNIQSLPLEDLSRPEALSLMQKLQHLATASHAEKLQALKTFGGHPYALVTLDRYCNHQPLSRALEDAKSIHAELREFLAIELSYAKLSERARDLLNRLAAFRQSVPYEAAEWVMGKKGLYASEFLHASRDGLPEKWKALDEAEILRRLETLLPEQRQADDLAGPLGELIGWGLLTPIQEDGQLAELAIHALVRDFCRDKQEGETWGERLRDAAAFYTNATKLTQQEDKSPVAIWMEMEAFELLMEGQDFEDAAVLLVGVTELLNRWGFGQYLEAQHRRLFGKLDAPGSAAILHNFGSLIHERGDYEQALEYYNRSLKISEELGDRSGVASTNGQIGIIHQHRGRYEQALEYYTHSLKILEELNDRSGVAISLHQIGNIHYHRRNHEEALEYYERSLKIEEELNNRSGVASSLHQIGTIHRERGHYKQALEHYDRSLKISEELGDRSGVAGSLRQIGNVNYHRGEYDQALEYYNRALKIEEELGSRAGVATSLGQIGILFIDVGTYEEAFKYLLSALTVFIELESPNTALVVNNIKQLRVKWGKEQFDAAWREATDEDVPDFLKE
jgi:tetratricopeptide (TPR) repeat protein